MPRFKVRCYDHGVWDEVPPIEIEAVSMMEAAESIAGQSLCRVEHPDRLRAAVWTAGAIPEAIFFYLPAPAARVSRVLPFRRRRDAAETHAGA